MASGIWWASLSIVQLPMLVCGEREAMVMAPPLHVTQQCRLASMPALLSSTGISHHDLLPHIPLICLSSVNSSSSTIPKLQLPAAVPSRRPAFLSGVCMPVARTVWFSYHLGCHRSAVSLSAINVSSLTQTIAPLWGIRPLLQLPHPLKAGPVLLTPVFSPPRSFVVSSFAWFYIFFSIGQVLLSVLSWCSACTSVSEDVFLMYPWREVYSTVHLLLCHLVLLPLRFLLTWLITTSWMSSAQFFLFYCAYLRTCRSLCLLYAECQGNLVWLQRDLHSEIIWIVFPYQDKLRDIVV